MLPTRVSRKFESLTHEAQTHIERQIDQLLAMPRFCTQLDAASRRIKIVEVTRMIPRPRPAKIHHVPQGALFQMTPDLKISMVGSALQRLLGLPASQLLGDEWQNLLDADQLLRLLTKWDVAARTRTGFVHTYWCYAGHAVRVCVRQRVRAHFALTTGAFMGWNGYVRAVRAPRGMRARVYAVDRERADGA